MMRTLVQSKPGVIELLPALPAALPSGTISGVVARGRVLVKSLEWDPKHAVVVIESPHKQSVQVKARGVVQNLSLEQGKAFRAEFVF